LADQVWIKNELAASLALNGWVGVRRRMGVMLFDILFDRFSQGVQKKPASAWLLMATEIQSRGMAATQKGLAWPNE
jgi:hypothetical protein